ncbi:MAG: hypothetical protein CMF46_01325 [Legionellales bacterium]|nr:hypothetical protein [Legionellales bacterium]|tara:strand:+ start:141 stop:713 length:573 start_codon:yes stop_codon:yes gene_type:complete
MLVNYTIPLLTLYLLGCQMGQENHLADELSSPMQQTSEHFRLSDTTMSFSFSDFYHIPDVQETVENEATNNRLLPPNLLETDQDSVDSKRLYSMRKIDLDRSVSHVFKSLSFENDGTIIYLKKDKQSFNYWFRITGFPESVYVNIMSEPDNHASINLFSSKGSALPIELITPILEKLDKQIESLRDGGAI